MFSRYLKINGLVQRRKMFALSIWINQCANNAKVYIWNDFKSRFWRWKGFWQYLAIVLHLDLIKTGEWSCAETKSLLQGKVARNSRAVGWKLSRRAQLCPKSFSLLVRVQPAGIRTSYKSTTEGAKDGWDCGLRPSFPCHHGAFPSADIIYGVHANKDWSFRGKWS